MFIKYFNFAKFLIVDFLNTLSTKYNYFILKQHFPTASFEEGVQVKSSNLLTLGNKVIIQKNTILHCGGMEWSNYHGYIKINDNSIISPNCVLYGGGGIEIGKDVELGPGVMILSSRTVSGYLIGEPHNHTFKKVVIGDNVVIYAGVIISQGANIGKGSVIGAGSLVLSDVPAREFWAGTPARFINKLN